MKVKLSDILNHWHDMARIFGNMRALEIDGFDGEAEIEMDEGGKVTIVTKAKRKAAWPKKVNDPVDSLETFR